MASARGLNNWEGVCRGDTCKQVAWTSHTGQNTPNPVRACAFPRFSGSFLHVSRPILQFLCLNCALQKYAPWPQWCGCVFVCEEPHLPKTVAVEKPVCCSMCVESVCAKHVSAQTFSLCDDVAADRNTFQSLRFAVDGSVQKHSKKTAHDNRRLPVTHASLRSHFFVPFHAFTVEHDGKRERSGA